MAHPAAAAGSDTEDAATAAIGAGPRSSPRLAEEANSHGGRGPNLRVAAAAANPSACNASPSADPVAMIGAVIASNANSNVVNVSRQCAARAANRRSQPRTVLTGRPSSVAILRCPVPLALASNPVPITAALSALRASMNAGSST